MLPDGLCACPIDTAFDVIGKKWTIQLLRGLLEGDHQFNQLLLHIEGLNPKTLSSRLKDLERERLIAKRIVQMSPVKISYELTEKGYAILPILRGMARWSFVWAPEKVFKSGKAPKEIQECLEQWQAALVGPNAQLVVKRAMEPVQVEMARAPPRRRTP